MSEGLRALTEEQLLHVIHQHNLATLTILNMLGEARFINHVLQQELKRRMAENQKIPASVKAELDRIGRAIGG